MSDNIVLFTGVTSLDLPADRVLQAAIDEGLEQVVIMGYTKDGEEYFASSVAGGPEVLWLLERSKIKLLGVVDEELYI